MTTWIVGDIHGCSDELARLIECLDLGPGDRLLSCGDLFHRGPDPIGVVRLLSEHGARFILGNHERAVLSRCGLAPRMADASDRPPLRSDFPPLDAEDLAGDGRRPCTVEPHDRPRILEFLQEHSGYYLTNAMVDGAGPTADGRDWWLVHAGIQPGLLLEDHPIEYLTSMRRLSQRGKPWWYEAYEGPELVVFGHTPSPYPRAKHSHDRLVALGLDTGCVYGGSLTAYSPELDEVVSVAAAQPYAKMA